MARDAAVGDDHHRAFLDATLPHLDTLHRVARGLTRDSASADDLVQETYLRAFTGFGRYRGGNTRAWLVAICLNTARSQARRATRRPIEVFDLEAVAEHRGDDADVAEQVLTALDREAVHDALRSLPPEQRLCIILTDLAGLTAAETAELLDCPRGTVLARVHRGRRRLARILTAAGANRDRA